MSHNLWCKRATEHQIHLVHMCIPFNCSHCYFYYSRLYIVSLLLSRGMHIYCLNLINFSASPWTLLSATCILGSQFALATCKSIQLYTVISYKDSALESYQGFSKPHSHQQFPVWHVPLLKPYTVCTAQQKKLWKTTQMHHKVFAETRHPNTCTTVKSIHFNTEKWNVYKCNQLKKKTNFIA